MPLPENSRLPLVLHATAGTAVPAVVTPAALLPHASAGTLLNQSSSKQIASPLSPQPHHFTLPSPTHRVPPLPIASVVSGTSDLTGRSALFPGQHLYSNTSPIQRNNIALPANTFPLHLSPAPIVFPYSPIPPSDPSSSEVAAAQLDLTIAQLEQSVLSLQQQLSQGIPSKTHLSSPTPTPAYPVVETDPGVKSPLTVNSLDTANSTLGSQVATPALLVTPSPPAVSVRSSQSNQPSSRSSVATKMNHSSDICSSSGSEGSSSPESQSRHHTHHHHPSHQQANMRQHVRLTPQQKEAAMLEQAREREAEEQDEDEDDEECEDGHEGLSDSKMKRGHGSSCHQCKTTKEPKYLFFCTNKAEKGVRKRRCRKKYCDSCLNRSYGNHASEVIPSWQCPSCLGLCICAACHRKTTLRKNGGGSVTSGPSAAATAAAANHHQEAIRLAGLAEKRNQANASANGESYSPLSMPSKTRTLSNPSSANLSPLTISRSLSGSPRFHSRSSLGKGNSSHSNSSSSLAGMDSEHEGSMDPHSFQITEDMEKIMVGMDHHQRASYLAEVSGKNSNNNSNRNSPRGSPRSVKRKIRGSNPSTDMGSPTQQVKLHMKQRLNSKLHSENSSLGEAPLHIGLPPSHAAYSQGNRRGQQLPNNIGLDLTSPNPSYGYLQSPSMMPHSSQHLYPLSIPSTATQLPDDGLVDGSLNSHHPGLFSPSMPNGVFSPGPPQMDHTQMYENQYYQIHHQHSMPPVAPHHHSQHHHHHHHHQPQLPSPNPAFSTMQVNVTQSSSRQQQLPHQATMPVKLENTLPAAAGLVSPAIPPEPVINTRLEVPHQRQSSSNSLIPPPLNAPVKLEWGTAQHSMTAPMASPNPLLSPLPEASNLYTYQTANHSASQQATNMAMSFFSSPTSMSTQTPSTTSSLGYPSSSNGALFSPNPTASPSASHAGHALVYPSTYLPEPTDDPNFTFRQLSIGGQNCVMSETPNGAGLFAGGRLVSAASAGWGAFAGSRGVSAVDHEKDLHLLLNPDMAGTHSQGIHMLPAQPSLIGR